MKNKIYLLCGLPGAGKSTWAKRFVEDDPDTIIINKDKIREMIFGQYKFEKGYENLVKKIQYAAMNEALLLDSNVILDATHINKEQRMAVYEQIADQNFVSGATEQHQVIIVYFAENEDNLKYRMLDPKGQSKETWEFVINSMKEKFEEPYVSEHFLVSEVMKVGLC